MRPGDLVELKEGLFGLKSPENLAIFLERRKRKKEFTVVVVTVRGTKEVRPEQVTGRRFHASVDAGMDEEALVLRLRDLMKEAGTGALDARGDVVEGLTERRAWELLVARHPEGDKVEVLADALAEGPASKGDVRRLQELLEQARRPGLGFFERAERGRWRPIPVEEFKAFHRTMEALNRLRKRLVRIVMVDDDDSGEPYERLEGVPVEAVDLDADERALLAACAEAMRDYVLHDRWRDEVTAPGTTRHTLEGQSFHRLVDHLAQDWTGIIGTSRSSVFVSFLVDAAGMSVQDAIRLVARRKVLATPGFAWTTPEDIEDWADRYKEPAEQNEADPSVYAPRADLRDLETYTIDPPDAKDFDDAVSLIAHEDGAVTLWVHIADVSHYVEKDSRLDRHARERATSVYLPTGVLPMLPRRLSDDLCSLREARDRLAMSVRIETDAAGHVTAYEPVESVIRVDQNLSYNQVDAWMNEGREPFASLQALAERMRSHRRGLAIETGELRIRFAEAEALRAARREGLVEGEGQNDDEDPTGLSIQIKHASPATRMIETFMVAANEAVSRFVAERAVAVPYRCHPLPEREKAARFEHQAAVLGLDVRMDLPEPTSEAGAQGDPVDDEDADADAGPSILDQLKGGKLQLGGFAASDTVGSAGDEDEEEAEAEGPAATRPEDDRPSIQGLAQLSEADREAWLAPFRTALEAVGTIEDEGVRELAYMKVLSTLGRAFYTPRNLGHFGLGSTSYAHFTSPIRRYPDLVLHRQLRWVLRGGDPQAEEPPHMSMHLESLCDVSSQQAEAAERLERDLLGCCMTFESRREAWRGPLVAVVNGMTSGGVFLSLPGNLEARLGMRDIPGGPYEVDEYGTMMFRARLPGGQGAVPEEDEARDLIGHDWRTMEDPDTGELRDVRLRLGDRVRVRITARDHVEGKVGVRLAGAL